MIFNQNLPLTFIVIGLDELATLISSLVPGVENLSVRTLVPTSVVSFSLPKVNGEFLFTII